MDARLQEVFGLDEELPRIVDCDQVVGATTVFSEIPVPVGGLIVDQQAALFAQRCLQRGEGKCTYGTGAFIVVNMGQAAPRFDNGLTTSVAWRIELT